MIADYLQQDILCIIALYATRPPMKLLDWIDEKELCIDYLSENPNAFDYFSNKWHMLNTERALGNTNKEIFDIAYKIAGEELWENATDDSSLWDGSYKFFANPLAFDIILERFDEIGEDNMCWVISNPKAASFIINNHESKIKKYSAYFNSNKSSEAVAYLEAHPEQINWYELSKNPFACRLLKKNMNKIRCQGLICNRALSKKTLMKAYKLCREGLFDRIRISGNPAAIELLRDHPNMISWMGLSENPAIFEADWSAHRAAARALADRWNVQRISKPN